MSGTRSTAIDRLIAESLAIEAEEAVKAGALGFMARALVQATLPHRRVAGNEFTRRNGAFTLNLLAPSAVGLPYGTVPRLLLAWLTTEAVRTRSRELVLGDSLSGFMRDLGLVPTGGRWGSITRLKSQTQRLFSATVSCTYQGRDSTGLMGYRIADKAMLWWHAKAPEQAALWQSTVSLSEPFFREVIEHPVPVDMRALKALKRSPLALDLYAWLTYRMSYLSRATEIPWAALAAQFGADYKRVRDFKAAFLTELLKVLAVYPEAKAEEGSAGLLLKPSRPHVAALGRRV
jgi:hypothetical protein